MSKNGGFSPRTKDATSGGGVNGAKATIAEIGVVGKFTYGGRQKDNPQAAVRVVFEIEGMEKPWEDHYTFGKSEGFEVIDDGYGIRSETNKGLNKKSAAFFLMEALEAAAVASDLDIDDLVPVEDDGFTFRPLEGKTVILVNKPFTNVSGDTKDKPVPAQFVEAGGRATATTHKSGNGKVTGVEAKTIAAIEKLIEDEGTIKKADVPNLVYEAHRKDTDAKAMMQWAFKESNLAADGRPWAYDRKRGVLKAAE